MSMRRKPQQTRSQERVNRILDEAERLFIEVGYEATTTKAIASKAGIPIGTLYQFFPSKAAIATGLAVRYIEQIKAIFAQLHTPETAKLPLVEHLDRAIDTFHQFYATHPGFLIVFGLLRSIAPEIQSVNAEFDRRIEADVAKFFQLRNRDLDPATAALIAKVASEVIRTLQTAALLADDRTLREQILLEAKKLLLSYLQLYLP